MKRLQVCEKVNSVSNLNLTITIYNEKVFIYIGLIVNGGFGHR